MKQSDLQLFSKQLPKKKFHFNLRYNQQDAITRYRTNYALFR